MIVAHGTWIPSSGGGGRFFLWGETGSPAPPRGRTKAGAAPLHPFHSPRRQIEEEIFGAFGENGYDASFSRAESDFLLPSLDGEPVASPELVVDERVIAPPKRLAKWRIPGLSLAPMTALGWLASLPADLGSNAGTARAGCALLGHCGAYSARAPRASEIFTRIGRLEFPGPRSLGTFAG